MLPDSIKAILVESEGPLGREELLMDESMKALEFAIYCELKECVQEFNNNKDATDNELVNTIAELQCALDILQGANTNEARIKVYEILKSLGRFPQ